MHRRAVLAGAALALLAGVAPLHAHHGWSGYDAQNPVTLEGEIVHVEYRNPHVMIHLTAADKTWEVVLAPPSRMTARGLPDGSLKEGEKAVVVGYVHTREPDELRAERITVNGKSIELR